MIRANRKKQAQPRPPKKRPAATTIPRDPAGKFLKGCTGNPSGRPEVVKEIRELARQHGPAAIERLRTLMYSPDGAVAVAACRAMLDRGFGRPESTVSLPNGGSLVSIQLSSAPISTAEEADRAYRAIIGDPAFDFLQLSFAPTAPPEPIEEPTFPVAAPSAGDPPEAAPATAPVEPPNNVVDLALWERLGK